MGAWSSRRPYPEFTYVTHKHEIKSVFSSKGPVQQMSELCFL